MSVFPELTNVYLEVLYVRGPCVERFCSESLSRE
jgi:hypothetical protein